MQQTSHYTRNPRKPAPQNTTKAHIYIYIYIYIYTDRCEWRQQKVHTWCDPGLISHRAAGTVALCCRSLGSLGGCLHNHQKPPQRQPMGQRIKCACLTTLCLKLQCQHYMAHLKWGRLPHHTAKVIGWDENYALLWQCFLTKAHRWVKHSCHCSRTYVLHDIKAICLDNRLKVVRPTHWPHSTPQKHYFSVFGTHFC
jgi:hypothetical protein